jgi:hypothetical protein
VHGHIADSVGDHCRPIRPPDRVTSWAGPGFFDAALHGLHSGDCPTCEGPTACLPWSV